MSDRLRVYPKSSWLSAGIGRTCKGSSLRTLAPGWHVLLRSKQQKPLAGFSWIGMYMYDYFNSLTYFHIPKNVNFKKV